MGIITVGREPAQLKAAFPAGDEVQDSCPCNAAQYLCEDVRDQVFGLKAPPHPKPDRNSRVQVAP